MHPSIDYVNYYLNGQVGGSSDKLSGNKNKKHSLGQPYIIVTKYQRGSGFSSIISSVVKFLKPILYTTSKIIGREALESSINTLQKIKQHNKEGQKVKLNEILKKEAKRGVRNILNKGLNRLSHNLKTPNHTQEGAGVSESDVNFDTSMNDQHLVSLERAHAVRRRKRKCLQKNNKLKNKKRKIRVKINKRLKNKKNSRKRKNRKRKSRKNTSIQKDIFM